MFTDKEIFENLEKLATCKFDNLIDDETVLLVTTKTALEIMTNQSLFNSVIDGFSDEKLKRYLRDEDI